MRYSLTNDGIALGAKTTPIHSSPAALHATLRRATRPDRRSIDQALFALDLTVVRDYGVFLNIHFTALTSLAIGWREEDRADFTSMLQCLQEDLRAIGVEVNTLTAVKPLAVAGSLHQWGVGYVIRGSRLKSKRHPRPISADFATSYLDFLPTISWPQFLLELHRDSRVNQASGLTLITHGARLAFAVFAAVAVAALETSRIGGKAG